MSKRVARGRENHLRCDCQPRLDCDVSRSRLQRVEKTQKGALRRAETPQSQAKRQKRKQKRSPQEKSFCGTRQRTKPAKACPHWQAAWRSIHFRPDVREARQGWIAASRDQRQIPRSAENKPHQSSAWRSPIATCAFPRDPARNTVRYSG